jgi:Zn-dependent M28 family amino/carboxypeptidase
LLLDSHIEQLASDEFAGREPGTEGGQRSVDYLVEQLRQLPLTPGNDGRYTQTVPLLSATLVDPGPMQLTAAGDEGSLAYGSEIQYWTQDREERVELNASDLVYVGYGIVAPEYGWNDYAGVDVTGKTVVMLVNDPGFATEDPEVFDGRAMTRYGRWTYKFAEAARQGASGAIIVHETEPAGYGWGVVSGSWSGPQYRLDAASADNPLTMASWIQADAAESLFSDLGLAFDELKAEAASPSFTARSLDASVSVSMQQQFGATESPNVLAYVPGRSRPDEVIVYTAHWDHLGRAAEGDDTVYNGAVDNATGTAAVLAMARAFSAMEPAPERSVLFLLVTAEEQGLLGSKYYAENPVFPLANTVAVINMDAMNFFGATRDMIVVGRGRSELEAYLERAADEAGRVLRPEAHPERGYFFRSDHYSLASKGVPALYTKPGREHLTHGESYGRARMQQYLDERYHSPSDEKTEDWDLSGLAADARLLFQVGRALSETETFPEWYPDSEFHAIREESRQAGGED